MQEHWRQHRDQAELGAAQSAADHALMDYHVAVRRHERTLMLYGHDSLIRYVNIARERHRQAVRRLMEIEVAMGGRSTGPTGGETAEERRAEELR